ncbi:DUF4129 domain-containing protein [Amycolatopsis regifaucium]|uniref:Protein-glutamine gamma-glutamyltransferase-like C-terminal domain-containing protein n=1 Tax=Amycolatopsis regifaucium TaxID=546365 RepID=A0A154MCV9_9PSEU|nr:DUF4129 domain-containing protein [Amycolatopsis regifaucium]KZB82428.1 hypothetical protein AVL48_11020 [Amycolatopsis regifaucium]OKA10175.1 hypothetical protein ATP06_0204530 [Amycolatopsis regifaucium]SFJ44627.1 protein of unknown function [Amycolatopsis regifaucium]
MVTRLLTEVPVDIDRDTARLRAAEELSGPAYQAAKPSWLSEAFSWVVEKLLTFLTTVDSAVPGGIFAVVVLIVVVIALFVVVRLRSGPLATSAKGERAVFAGRRKPSGEHRKAAAEAAARGDFDDAVRELFRALVRSLEERALLDEKSGRTADEAAIEAGRLLPDVADSLRAGARLFDDVHYGGIPATEAGYRSLSELDDRCRRSRPVALAAG